VLHDFKFPRVHNEHTLRWFVLFADYLMSQEVALLHADVQLLQLAAGQVAQDRDCFQKLNHFFGRALVCLGHNCLVVCLAHGGKGAVCQTSYCRSSRQILGGRNLKRKFSKGLAHAKLAKGDHELYELPEVVVLEAFFGFLQRFVQIVKCGFD
jgi:hypothetical protein